MGCTISGPPSTVKQLLAQSHELADIQKVVLPIYGAFHAGHLSFPDIDRIIAPASTGSRQLRPSMFMLSPATERTYMGRSVMSILSQGLEDILQAPISYQNIISHTATQLKGSTTNMRVVGPNWGTKIICQELVAQGVTLLENHFSAQSHATCETAYKDDIVVVGMSGRFPGGSSLEEFWNALEGGRDLHTQVRIHYLTWPMLVLVAYALVLDSQCEVRCLQIFWSVRRYPRQGFSPTRLLD